ncbi:aminoglycoside phosphotransferase family protein [Aureispira anguillae]|uniref:Aminoglycoside phosphotransferase family protein n=1 Tax=Aureispira anguillae TaxID=2864201 RepID=A0A916DWG3_9BACT|nr:aminoglycoside phosphotransferase family protein [Aureispira anguillae]BDS14772.1 aminoglycoside phosphotransferase family protein [Aureispira anguillae]
MYSIDTIQDFLLDQQLLDKNTIVFEDFEATSINRRNQNIQITTLNDSNFLIKQVADKNAENATTLKREAQFYQYFDQKFPLLEKYLPEVKYVDTNDIILVMTFYKEAMPLWKYYNEKTIHHFPLNVPKTIGKLLAHLHLTFSKKEVINAPQLSFLNRDLPFILNLHKPHPSRLSYISGGGYAFIKHLQSHTDLMLAFNKIPSLWQENAVIHGDIKLDNFIVLDPQNKTANSIKLVDWEMAQIGDTAWDVAGVFNDFIFWWVISMPDNLSPEEMIQKARFPFHLLTPAINSYWESYCNTIGLTTNARQQLLERVVLFSGFRVLQTSFEIASKFDAIPSIAQLLLNMGKSIIRKPLLSQEKLFGIANSTP